MKNAHTEIESKYRVDTTKITRSEFLSDMATWPESKYRFIGGVDVYYEQGTNVLRYRAQSGPSGEITVKKRRSSKSTVNRLEINLKFLEGTEPEDVMTFLEETGWKTSTIVYKKADIFDIYDNGVHTSLIWYEVSLLENINKISTFLEVEVEADSNLSIKERVERLQIWDEWLQTQYNNAIVRETKSLYEIYSGKTYQMDMDGAK